MTLFFVGYFLFLASFFAFSVFNLCLYIFHLNGLHFSVHFIFICVFFIEIFIVMFIALHYCLYCLDFSHFFDTKNGEFNDNFLKYFFISTNNNY